MTTEQFKEKLKQFPQYRGEIASRNQARQLPTGLAVGDIFWINNEDKAQIVIDKGKKDLVFTDLDMNATVSTGMTIYDLNKSIVSKEPLFVFGDNDETYAMQQKVEEWFGKTRNTYYLLYCRDINYLTLFGRDNTQMVNQITLFECIAGAGDLISIDFNDEALEIWIRTENEPALVMYLLPFDNGLVEI